MLPLRGPARRERRAMTLEDEGFLSREVDALAAEALQDFAPEHVAIVRRVNAFALAVARMQRGVLDADLDRYLLTSALLGRAIQEFEAAITLALRGFRSQARALVRETLETAMYCTAASRNQSLTQGAARKVKKGVTSTTHFADAFEGGHTKHRAKMAAELQQIPGLPRQQAAMLAQLLEQIGDQHQDVELHGLAKDLGLSDLYTVLYRPLSQHAHPSATSLDHHIERSPEGKIRGLRIGPDFTDFADTLIVAMCSLLVAVDGFLDQFGTEEEKLEMATLAAIYCDLSDRPAA